MADGRTDGRLEMRVINADLTEAISTHPVSRSVNSVSCQLNSLPYSAAAVQFIVY